MTLGYIVMTKMLSNSMNLRPVVILTSLLLWSVAGALLSMSIIAIIKIIFDNVDSLNPVGVLMKSGTKVEKVSREAV